MRALVTGAAGLIGAHLVRTLLDRGHTARALVRETSRRDALSGLPVEITVADVLHAGRDLDIACAGCDVVFHGAAHFAYGVDATTLLTTAVNGTENMLAACARMGVSRVVVTSSSVVFGHCKGATCMDETAGLATDAGEPPYVAAKIAQHRRTLELGARLKLDVRLACPTMTLGPTAGRLGPSNGIVVAYLADPFGCTFPGGCNLVIAHDVAIGHALIAETRRRRRKLSARVGKPDAGSRSMPPSPHWRASRRRAWSSIRRSASSPPRQRSCVPASVTVHRYRRASRLRWSGATTGIRTPRQPQSAMHQLRRALP